MVEMPKRAPTSTTSSSVGSLSIMDRTPSAGASSSAKAFAWISRESVVLPARVSNVSTEIRRSCAQRTWPSSCANVNR
jgi:hypothetical protein